MKNIKTKEMVFMALFAAFTGILSQISVPLPFTPIPMNLAILSVFVAAGLLGSVKGSISQIVYLCLGAVGLPVFANFSGGLGVVVGPTGGYLIGYVVATFVIGIVLEKTKKTTASIAIAMLLGLAACYIFGTIWFMLITKTALLSALSLCVFPFLLGDSIKIAAGTFLVKRLENSLKPLIFKF